VKIGVVGLGKIGLPLAVQFASKGFSVTGVDIDANHVREILAGTEIFPDEAELHERSQGVIRSGYLSCTTDLEETIRASDVVVVVVPLVTDSEGSPSFGLLDSAAASVGRSLKAGSLVIFETTVPIGTTRNRLKPIIENASNLKEGTDFHLAYSPERVFSGRIFEDLRKYPKIVGGLSQEGSRRAVSFYSEVLDFDLRDTLPEPNGVWDVGSSEAAEFVKLAETTYRDVNISLANQFARHAEDVGVDVWRVIEAANSQHYSHVHSPGISVGGHCIPVYPHLYMFSDQSAGIVSVARNLNSAVPERCAQKLLHIFADLNGVEVAILGLAYRQGVKEDSFSGAYSLASELTRLRASPSVHDPLYTSDEIASKGLAPLASSDQPEAIIVNTDHPEYRLYSKKDFPSVKCVIDGRGTIDRSLWLDTPVWVIGKGWFHTSADSERPETQRE
jgi:nucleotide sugar dehydrogenase